MNIEKTFEELEDRMDEIVLQAELNPSSTIEDIARFSNTDPRLLERWLSRGERTTKGICRELYKRLKEVCSYSISEALKFRHEKRVYDSAPLVYFAYSPTLNIVKIGISEDPKSRIKGNSFCPLTLILIGTLKGGSGVERGLHLEYKQYQWLEGDSTEWFKVEGGLKNFIMQTFPENIHFLRHFEDGDNRTTD